MPTPITYLPYSLSLSTSEEKSESPDIGGVFLVRAMRRRKDEIDGRFRERDDVLWIAAPVGVRALYGDLPTDDLRLEQALQFGLEVRSNRHRDVVKVDHQRRIGRVGGGFFVDWACEVAVLLLRLRCHN